MKSAGDRAGLRRIASADFSNGPKLLNSRTPISVWATAVLHLQAVHNIYGAGSE